MNIKIRDYFNSYLSYLIAWGETSDNRGFAVLVFVPFSRRVLKIPDSIRFKVFSIDAKASIN